MTINPLIQKQLEASLDMMVLDAYLESKGSNLEEFSESLRTLSKEDFQVFSEEYQIFYQKYAEEISESMKKGV
jgi:hypothetical protein